jgi:hypothetical protein
VSRTPRSLLVVMTAALVLSATPAVAQPVEPQAPPTWREIPGLALDMAARWVKRQIDARNMARTRDADEKAQEKLARAQAAAEELRLSEALFDRMLNEDGTGPEVQRAEAAVQAAQAAHLKASEQLGAARGQHARARNVVESIIAGRVLALRQAQEGKRWQILERAYAAWVKAVKR